MSKVVPIDSSYKRPKPHDKRKAKEIINKISENSDNVKYTKHVIVRMQERGFNYNDMLTILREGAVQKEPLYSEEKRCWSYRVDFINFDGNRDAGCVVAIRQKGKLQVITIMWID